MKKTVIDNAVFDQLPDYCVGVVVANGINNQESITSIQEINTVVDFGNALSVKYVLSVDVLFSGIR